MKKKAIAVLFILIILIFLSFNTAVYSTEGPRIETSIPKGLNQIAPGDSLPFTVVLTNFGNKTKTDVTILYEVRDGSNNTVFESSETVAVETTASFIRSIEFPSDFKPGTYFLVVEILYPGQISPAVSSMKFEVLPGLFGIFLKDLVAILLVFTGAVLVIITLFLLYLRETKRFISSFDYSHISKNKRTYYKIIDKVISIMRLHAGDKVIEGANRIDGLKVSEKGEVLELRKNPAEVLAVLTSKYQHISGIPKKVKKTLKSEEQVAPDDVTKEINTAVDYIHLIENLRKQKSGPKKKNESKAK
ncbi:MAG: hypothetical protein R6U26_01080 [Candidatus Undinarchaeales archaeon]